MTFVLKINYNISQYSEFWDQRESNLRQGLSWPWSYGSWIYNYLCNQCLSPMMFWVQIPIRERCTILCDKVCQWSVTGRWCSPSTPVSSTNKSDRHDIAEILLKVVYIENYVRLKYFLCNLRCYFLLAPLYSWHR